MLKELYIIRHGETEYNSKGIVQGRGVDAPLNDFGHKQAKQFFDTHKHIPFAKVYTSSLQRTHQTVALFINEGIDHEELSGLDELDWGIYEGAKASAESRKNIIDLTGKWAMGQLDEKSPEGENPLEVQTRQKEAINHIMSQTDEKTILICMHGRALRVLLAWLTEKGLTEMETFPHQNLSLYKLLYVNGTFTIDLFNYTQHLQA